MIREKDKSYLEERPIIELPILIKIAIIGMAFLLGLSVLFIPWYFALLAFFSFAFLVAIFFDPYFGLLAFLIGSLLHPVEFFADVLGPLHLSRNLAFGVLFIWLFHIIVYRDFKIVKTKQNIIIFLFGTTLFISTLRYFDYSFYGFLEFIKLLILYFLVVNLVKTKKKFLILIWGLVILGLAACLIGIYQYAHGIGVDYGEGVIRIRGTAFDPNDYAMHLVILIPLVFALFFNYRNVITRTLLILIFVLLILNVVFTYSRGGMVALIFVLASSVLWFGFKHKRKILAVVLLSVFLLGIVPFIPVQYWARAKSVFDLSDPSINSRLEIWKVGLQMMKDHPFRGIGLNVFQYEYVERAFTASDIKTRVARFSHNAYLQIGAETGIFGLIFFLLLLFFSWQDLKKAGSNFQKKKDFLLSDLALSLRLGLLGYLVCAVFLTQAFLTMLWIILPLAVVMKKFSDES